MIKIIDSVQVTIILHLFYTNIVCVKYSDDPDIYRKVGVKYSDDPDIYRNVTGFITSRGFHSKSYEVITNDGYILTIFRIINPYINPGQLKRRPVLIWHGIAESAEKWLFNRKGRLDSNGVYSEGKVANNCRNKLTSTLGFTLSACGFDVWLANSRGNQYGNRNVKFSDQDPRFWEYTITEMALNDVPATINFVLQITQKDDLSYIGFSMGTVINFVLLSLRPEFEHYFRPYIALAPTVFTSYSTSILEAFSPIEQFIRYVAIPFGLPRPVAEFIGAFVCGNKLLRIVCIIFYDLVSGKDPFNTDKSRLPAHFGNFLENQSTRIYVHGYQIQNSDRFAFFNYGKAINLLKYNQTEPPSYPLERIALTHIYLFNGLNDKIADPRDVKHLYDLIRPNVKLLRTNPWPKWTHLDVGQAVFENKYQDSAILDILLEYN